MWLIVASPGQVTDRMNSIFLFRQKTRKGGHGDATGSIGPSNNAVILSAAKDLRLFLARSKLTAQAAEN